MTAGTQQDNVKNFYKNSVILITGGSGFLGKVLIEKLLRVFDVRKIYVLIRFKNNMCAEDRLAALLNESVSSVHNLGVFNPEFYTRLFPELTGAN